MTYVPVYTLHEMLEQTGQKPDVPVVICSGCSHPIPAPRGSALIQCRDCGKKMQVKSISPAAQSTRAT
jgi:LSD1 subclass zinc finger protein